MTDGVPVQAISRAVATLKLINREGSANLMTIAKSCSMAYPTTVRVVQTLVFEGMIEIGPGKQYRLTPQGNFLAESRRCA